MKVFILCGGMGRRLGSIGETIPKSLIEIKSRPVLDYQIEFFNKNNIPICLLARHKAELIKERYQDIEIVIESEPLGTAGSLLHALKNGHDDGDDYLILVNGDNIFKDIDIGNMINFAKNKNSSVIGLTKLPSPYGIVILERDRVIEFAEKPILNNYINAGITVLKKSDFLEVFNKRIGSIELDVYPILAKMGKLHGLEVTKLWKSIDTLKDIEVAENLDWI